ncbi:MAG: hypothetical protein HY834_14770 [Devosia nanyangense]|uniref:Uncharacterized protein n=1 Tax=Devosia nanyangense TaxID=1228055 RepID=A0A933L630_9HYPH|nr:hypothetical protein [Devosia nanyangense]
MVYQFPPFLATYLNRFPQAQARLERLVPVVDLLAVEQGAKFAADQRALANVKDAEAKFARYRTDVAKGDVKADPAEAARLKRGIAAAQEARLTVESSVNAMTRVSHGTRVALERAVKFATELAQANADLELTKPPTMPKGTLAEVIAGQRAALEELDDEAEKVERAMQPKSETLALAMAELGAEVRKGRLGVTGRGSLLWPMALTDARPSIGSEPVKIVDATAVLAALHADELGAQVEAAVERMYADVPESEQLSAPEKRKRLNAIKAKRFEAELVEVEAVFKAWADGSVSVGLRPDVDPRAVLGVANWKAGEAR